MNRRRIAAGNWKMNTLPSEGVKFLTALGNQSIASTTDVVICAPFTHLSSLRSIANINNFELGAQDIYITDSGAYTGEISGPMLTDIGVSHVIIGHSERREYFSEDNAYLAQKLRHTLENNLIPIFCCGETLATRKAGEQNQFVLNQLEESFSAFTPDDLSTLVIAYEPIWAIGTGETASPEQAQEMHAAIRSWLAQRFSPDFAAKTPILYGGSVKANNAVELFGQADIDGGLVGGASLLIDQFAAIANAF